MALDFSFLCEIVFAKFEMTGTHLDVCLSSLHVKTTDEALKK